METTTPREPEPRSHRSPRPRTRTPLPERKRREREAARARSLARVSAPLSPEQRAFDPFAGGTRTRAERVAWVVGSLVAALTIHGAVVGFGLIVGGRDRGRRENVQQQVTIQVRERPPEPPPPPPAPIPPELPPEPTPVPKQVKPPTKVAKPEPVPAPPKAPPPTNEPPPKTPPPRVVGLSLESTAEGGSGPSFAVGNTREGTTAERAVAPKDVVPGGTGPADSTTNQVATRIPRAGVAYTQPVMKGGQRKPPYPDTLKAQGIEADVVVIVNIDATGKVMNVKIGKSAPYPEFNEAARKTALAQEFEPATRDGVAVPWTITFTYRFRLEDE